MDEIKGIARVKFHPGKVEQWKRLTEEAMTIFGVKLGATFRLTLVSVGRREQ